MPRQLPDNPNLEHLRNQAKALLKNQRRKDIGACGLLRLLPRFSNAPTPEILASDLSLHECQYAIALSYGFRSWPALRAFLLSHVKNDQEEITVSIVDNTSLSETLDAFNDVIFYGRKLAPARAEEAAHWIASREGKNRSYHNLPSPTPLDYQRGARLYTGERVTSGAGTGHILGEEACRALNLLGVQDEPTLALLDSATNVVAGFGDAKFGRGFFCCPTCSVALWRHLSVSPLEDAEERLADSMRLLSDWRDGTGKWRVFPFYYTILALIGLPEDLVRAELQYAVPTCERLLKRPATADRYAHRRRDLLERVLERC